MLSASWKAPLLTAASPKKHTATWSVSRYLAANAMPAASGMCPPTMPWPPRKPSSASKRCIEPPLPLEQPAALPNSSAITVRGDDAPGERVAVLAVGAGDVVVGPERGEAAHRDGLLADVEMAEAADLAEAVRLAGLLLEAADEQHLAEPVAYSSARSGSRPPLGTWRSGVAATVDPAITRSLGRAAARACSQAW